jgi:hypothetical protein
MSLTFVNDNDGGNNTPPGALGYNVLLVHCPPKATTAMRRSTIHVTDLHIVACMRQFVFAWWNYGYGDGYGDWNWD